MYNTREQFSAHPTGSGKKNITKSGHAELTPLKFMTSHKKPKMNTYVKTYVSTDCLALNTFLLSI